MRVSESMQARLAAWGLPALAGLVIVAALWGARGLLSEPEVRAPASVSFVGAMTAEQSAAARTETVAASAEAFAARPLFHVSRRPWQPAAVPQAAPVREVLPRLVGVIGYGDAYLALVAPDDTAPAQRVTAGYSVGPWTVTAVGPDRVDLVGDGGREIVLELPRAE